ncbi:uncharacterized protein [Physcomitrium patens]|uniref:Cyclohexanone monooxygenase n=1 Tax=Physcomitrium patens TaxID=3218 RepID=A0A2K1J202_PHYPA|nr:uncharacterized protein LOC112295402 [Physcomitrium patens]XP_024402702.1 uncharacterized protein LOC112295402 [Physcomitrium patens]XP_024402703.1 uncharacterized protein LOC112295402 [Physcomitrium patens]XP_024402704.1 uncharacterized protein LOC112295402 [Physcomitrium patens]PNR35556.1 hypothetical protein PHYPA_023456 [Physcomitrium patens]|eukprot:XP_024402700.1 uncharacterized protein LOC112295402 [Physcomitrella patens]
MSNLMTEFDAVIVGAGIAGLYQLYRLRNLGLRTHVLEAEKEVGGTWYLNKYPGARCDIKSIMYSYSFSPELEQEWNWSENYSNQPEILRYINHVADRFDLRKDITFNTRVTGALYNESSKRWEVHTDQGKTIRTQFLIMATGCLSTPKQPEIPGIEKFQGSSYYTGRWPDKPVDFTGKRVAVIGTGSSAVQSIPIIAQQASQLTVFQRSAACCVPGLNYKLTADEIAASKASYSTLRKAQRESPGGFVDERGSKSALEDSEEDRQARYEMLYQRGTLDAIIVCAYNDLVINKEANDTFSEFIRQKIRSIVKDPVVADSLSPRGYAVGTKRICLDYGYYETFNLDHVHLVDLTKTPILEMTEKGIRTSEKDHVFDAIVYATGFDAITGTLTRIGIQGKNKLLLKDKWAKGPRTYLGIAIAEFPNLFTITGPFSPSVFTIMTVAIEQHVDWITDCLKYLREHGVEEIEATVEAEDAWVEHSLAVANMTLFPKTASYYTGGNVEGKPFMLYPYVGGLANYRQVCDGVAAKGYEGFKLKTKGIV